jgi:hypothetical protein
MVHLNSALRLAQHETYTQRNTSRRSSVTASADSATPKATTDASANTAADDFRALFTNKVAPATPATPAAPAAQAAPITPASTQPPTAESVFGANPWIANPGGVGPNGITYSYNPSYFATPATAAKVAQMVGGKVVAMNAITGDGPFVQNQPNQMVQLPNGGMLNAGLIATFYNHGYPQSYINALIANEVNATNT